MTASLEMARRLLALGLSVIPVPRPRPGVQPGTPGDGKVPSIPWRVYQTRLPTDRELVAWFSTADQNIAVITGAISGVVVVDADERAAVRWVVRHLPYTPMQVRTARGYHLFYRCPEVPVPNRARVETRDGQLKLDVRGDGGYVIAPGSLHASGAVYHCAGDWTAPRARMPTFWPGWLARPQRPVPITKNLSRTRPTGTVVERARKYLAAIPRPDIGAGSDAAVLSAACRLVRGFEISAGDAESLLWEWCGGRPGWTCEWVAQKVAHALRYGTEPLGALC